MIRSPKLRLDLLDGKNWIDRDGQSWAEDGCLRQYFDLPKKVAAIWFVLDKGPIGKDSWAVRMYDYDAWVLVEGHSTVLWYDSLRRFACRIGENVYVAVEYESRTKVKP